jgi:hypothetical protein
VNTSQDDAHKTFAQRFEIKYLIDEAKAQAVADFVRPFVNPDEYTGPDNSYVINSLYYDSPSLSTFNASVHGLKNRVKMRLRGYTEAEDSPVFFEIKRRLNQIIFKQRARVTKEAARALTQGAAPAGLTGLPKDAKGMAALDAYRGLAASLAASPRVCVRYTREAYVAIEVGESARVTFDRHLACFPATQYTDQVWSHRPEGWLPVRSRDIVLEFKFTDTMPGWMRDAVRYLRLNSRSFGKYVVCTKHLLEKEYPIMGEHLEAGVWAS